MTQSQRQTPRFPECSICQGHPCYAKDAARYRWLRSNELGPGEHSVLATPVVTRGPDSELLVGDELDEAIDAAIHGGREK